MQFGLIFDNLIWEVPLYFKEASDKRWSLKDAVYNILEEDIMSNLEAPEWNMSRSRIYYTFTF